MSASMSGTDITVRRPDLTPFEIQTHTSHCQSHIEADAKACITFWQ
jgi:hypothetical protein